MYMYKVDMDVTNICLVPLQGSHWPGKLGKSAKNISELSFLQKVRASQETFFKMLIIMKLNDVVILIWKMLQLSFPDRTSCKMSKIVK